MTLWYRVGTATFTNGLPNVTGIGTAWVTSKAVQQGYAIVGPDGELYEVLTVNSDTSLTLGSNYAGSTATGAYAIFPTQGEVQSLLEGVRELIDATDVPSLTSAGIASSGDLVPVYQAGVAKKMTMQAFARATSWFGFYMSRVALDASDQSAALQNELDTIYAAGGGILMTPAGTVGLLSEVSVPPKVGLVAQGIGATYFRSLGPNGRITLIRGAHDGRGPHVGGFSFQGNGVGNNLMVIGLVVERNFFGIDVSGSAGHGVLWEGAQNCNGTGFNSQNNAGSNMVFDKGSGNNRLYGSELSNPGQWNVVFQQSGVSPVGAFDVPSGNRFIGGVIERGGDSAQGQIYHGAGRCNGIHQLDLAMSGLTTAKTMIAVEKAGAGASELFEVEDVLFSGTPGQTTAIEVRDNCSVLMDGRITFENQAVAFRVADNGRVHGVFNVSLGGVTTYFQNYGGGTQPMHNLIQSQRRQRDAFELPLDAIGSSYRVSGEAFSRTDIYPGRVRVGRGSALAAMEFGDVQKFGIDGVNLRNTNAHTDFVVALGNIDLLIVGSVPTQAAPNGSLASHYNAPPGNPVLYIRKNGNWDAVL